MDAEFARDALIEYGVDDVPSEATRPNPERKKLAKERKEANAEVTRLPSAPNHVPETSLKRDVSLHRNWIRKPFRVPPCT
jgi:hypothetical protein